MRAPALVPVSAAPTVRVLPEDRGHERGSGGRPSAEDLLVLAAVDERADLVLVHEDVVSHDGRREHGAVGVDDVTTLGVDRVGAGTLVRSLLGTGRALDDLHLDQAPGKEGERGKDDADHDGEPAGGPTHPPRLPGAWTARAARTAETSSGDGAGGSARGGAPRGSAGASRRGARRGGAGCRGAGCRGAGGRGAGGAGACGRRRARRGRRACGRAAGGCGGAGARAPGGTRLAPPPCRRHEQRCCLPGTPGPGRHADARSLS